MCSLIDPLTYTLILQSEHKHFRRYGHDIFMKQTISLWDALLGNWTRLPSTLLTLRMLVGVVRLSYMTSFFEFVYLTGFSMDVPSIDGGVATVQSPRDYVIKNGDEFVVKGKGMAIKTRDMERGDMVVKITVQQPSSLTCEQREAMCLLFPPSSSTTTDKVDWVLHMI